MRGNNPKDQTQSTSSSDDDDHDDDDDEEEQDYDDDDDSDATSSSPERSAEEEEIVRRLAEKAYHLPGYTWKQDWIQYFCNNHPLFAVCLQHKLHPIKLCMRLIALVGSVAFGLLLTNLVWLFYSNKEQTPVFTVSAAGIDIKNKTHYTIFDGNDAEVIVDYTTVEFTVGMIVLWTAGGVLHALFDEFVWTITTCGCCLRYSKLKWMHEYRAHANVFVVLLLTLVTAVSSLVIVIRVMFTDDSEFGMAAIRSSGRNNETIQITKVEDPSNYEFLIGYAVELAVVWLVYWPLLGTIMFSGILSCKRGGRPYEVAREEKEQSKSNRESNYNEDSKPCSSSSWQPREVPDEIVRSRHRSNDIESPHTSSSKRRSGRPHEVVAQEENNTFRSSNAHPSSSMKKASGRPNDVTAQDAERRARSSRRVHDIERAYPSSHERSSRAYEVAVQEENRKATRSGRRTSNDIESAHPSSSKGRESGRRYEVSAQAVENRVRHSHRSYDNEIAQPWSPRRCGRTHEVAGQVEEGEATRRSGSCSSNGINSAHPSSSMRSGLPYELAKEEQGKVHRRSNDIDSKSPSSAKRSARSCEVTQGQEEEARSNRRPKDIGRVNPSSSKRIGPTCQVYEGEVAQEEVGKEEQQEPEEEKVSTRSKRSRIVIVESPSPALSMRSGQLYCESVEMAQEEDSNYIDEESAPPHDVISNRRQSGRRSSDVEVAQEENQKNRRVDRATF